MKKIYSFILSCLFSVSAFSQITFQRHYGASENQSGNSIEQTFDGGYIIAGGKGFTSAVFPFLMKLDLNGDVTWTRQFNYPNWIGMYGTFFDVHQLADSGFIMSGYIDNGIASCLFVRTDEDGDTLWVKEFPDSLGEYPSSINLTTDGGFITGAVYRADTLNDHFNIIKLDTSGNISWTKPFYFGHIHNGKVFETSDHGYAIIGTVKESYMYASNNRMFIAKLDSTGDSLWTRRYFIQSAYGFSGQQTNDSGYIIAGIESNDSVPNAYVVKTDVNGDTLWTKLYGGTSLYDAYAHSIQQTQDLGYIICGTIDSIVNSESDVLLIKTDSSGNQQWAKSFTMLQLEYSQCVRETSDGGYVISGSTEDFIDYTPEVLVIKTNDFGNITTGVIENNNILNGVSIFPNPSAGTFHITIDNPEDVNEIVILDAVGNELNRMNNITDSQMSFTINNIPGIYFVRILQRDRISVSKVIVLSK